MCFSKPPTPPDPAPPPETLTQAAPDRSKANQDSAKDLLMGTAKYQTKTPKKNKQSDPTSSPQLALRK